jgi:hypothetical protein
MSNVLRALCFLPVALLLLAIVLITLGLAAGVDPGQVCDVPLCDKLPLLFGAVVGANGIQVGLCIWHMRRRLRPDPDARAFWSHVFQRYLSLGGAVYFLCVSRQRRGDASRLRVEPAWLSGPVVFIARLTNRCGWRVCVGSLALGGLLAAPLTLDTLFVLALRTTGVSLTVGAVSYAFLASRALVDAVQRWDGTADDRATVTLLFTDRIPMRALDRYLTAILGDGRS